MRVNSIVDTCHRLSYFFKPYGWHNISSKVILKNLTPAEFLPTLQDEKFSLDFNFQYVC